MTKITPLQISFEFTEPTDDEESLVYNNDATSRMPEEEQIPLPVPAEEITNTPDNQANVQVCQSVMPSLPDMRSFIPAPSSINVVPSTPEIVNDIYNYNYYSIDYGGQIKNDLIMYLAETILALMAENPVEAARALPRSVSNNYFSQTRALVKAENEQTDVLSSPQFQMQLSVTQHPFLLAATCYDLGFMPMKPDLTRFMLQEAYSILRELNIDTSNPYLIDPENLIPPQSHYRMGAFRQRPFIGLPIIFPFGDMGMPQEEYCTAPDGPIWPVRSLVKARNAYIKPCFLPHRRYSLFGLEKILYSNADPIVVTPDLTEYFVNNSYEKAVISWYGASFTLPKVDFSPLAGKSVIYVYNPGSFNFDHLACLHCMNQVTELLFAKGCSVTVMGNPLYHAAPVPLLEPQGVYGNPPVTTSAQLSHFE